MELHAQKNKLKILIIDDEEKLRALLARIIRLEGLTVLEAETGLDALREAVLKSPANSSKT